MMQIISDHMETILKHTITGSVGLITLWVLGIFLSRFIENNIKLEHHHVGIIQGFARTLKYFCIFLGIIVFLKEVGVDLHAAVAGLGLTGFSIGFALKDTISNVMAGAFILMYRPFTLGDYIIVSVETEKLIAEGTVQLIDFRYTTIQTTKGTMLVPNSILYTNSITIKKP